MPNEVLKLGYEAALVALARQDQSLSNIRNRAVGLLSAATVATAIGGSVGLINTDPAKGHIFPQWLAIAVVALTLAIGALVSAIVWPITKWHFHVNPLSFVLAKSRAEDIVREKAIIGLANAIAENQKVIRLRSQVFQIAIALVLLELTLIAGAAIFSGR